MEDYALDVMIGKGPSARSLRLSLKPFTVVGATTRPAGSAARCATGSGRPTGSTSTRSRSWRRSSSGRQGSSGVGDRRRRDAGHRPAWSRARRASSTACSSASATMPRSTATGMSTRRPRQRPCGRWRSTTRASTRPIASCWRRSSRSSPSGPVGVAALAAVLSEEIETIEDVYEPFLLRLGFIDRTPQGRIATDLARAHLSGLGYEIPAPRGRSRASPGCGTCRPPWTRRRWANGVSAAAAL